MVIAGDENEDQADGEQNLVEFAGAIEPPIEQPLEHDAQRGGGDKAERQRRGESRYARGSSPAR